MYPLTPYGLSKKLIGDMIKEEENFYNIIIYGLFDENELDTRFIKSNIKRCINDELMVIHKDKYMDFIHMKDLVNLVKWYINEDRIHLDKSFECRYEQTYRLTHITEMISLILGKPLEIGTSSTFFPVTLTAMPLKILSANCSLFNAENKFDE